jgi:phage terminase large subunit-like protein
MLDLSCRDWEAKIREGRSLVPAVSVNADEAKAAVGIFNLLHIPDVPGTPTMKSAAGEWFREIVRALFGSFDPTTGERAIRELFLLVPKKSGKTTYSAALMLIALLRNTRPRAEFILTGPTQEVAELAFRQAEGMIACDPDGFLQKRLDPKPHLKIIVDRRTKAVLRIKTFDTSVATGPKPAGILIDELHEVARIAKAGSIIGQLRGGMVSQPEAFLAFITTQSDQPPQGAFADELSVARRVRDGVLQGIPMLPVIYEFPHDMQRDRSWRDPQNWWMVTPNRGKSVTVERLQSDFIAAEAKGDAEIRRWCSQHLNIQIGIATRADGWAGAELWDRGVEEGLTLEKILARCEVVTVGIDGGGLDDLLGLGVIGRERGTKRWLGWARAWVSPEGMERRKANSPRYQDFMDDGDLQLVEKLPLDVEAVVAVVKQIDDAGLLAEVGVDAAGIGAIVDALGEIGVTTADDSKLAAVKQGIALMGAIKTIERKLADGSFLHGGARMMAWCVGNAKVMPTATAMRIARDESGYGKIDPLMALFNAAAMMALNPAGGGKITRAEEVIF